jgi:hypothetical protein
MKKRLAVFCCFVLALAALSGCGENGAAACVNAAIAGIKAVAGQINDAIQACPTIGPGTTSASPHEVLVCEGTSCRTVDACGPIDGDSACNSCLKTSCCSAVSALLTDPNIGANGPIAQCLVGCTSGEFDCGGTTMAAATAHCGAPDAAYDGLTACTSDHCADECAGLNLQ